MLQLIWLIPLLPLVGVVINGFWGRRMSRQAVGWVACAVVFASLLLAVGAVVQLAQLPAEERYHEVELGTWLPLGTVNDAGQSLHVAWGFSLDPLSAVMVLVVCGVGFLIHLYSTG